MESVYKIIEIIGSSEKSWEAAAKVAIDRASKTVKDLRVAEVKELDISIDDKGKMTYRAKMRLSFKYTD
jgi:hypothetical protein